MEELSRPPHAVSHLSEEDLVLFYYGEDGGACTPHLAACAQCRAGYRALEQDLLRVREMQAPARTRDYGYQVWRRLVHREPRLTYRGRGWLRALHVRQWAAAAVFGMLLAGAFLLGRVSAPRADFRLSGAPAPAARDRMLRAALLNHFEEAERVLSEIGNGGEVAAQRERAEELLSANRLYRLSASRIGYAALSPVLEDLERVLIDVADAPDRLSAGEREEIRERVRGQDLTFQLQVLSAGLRAAGSAPAHTVGKDRKGWY